MQETDVETFVFVSKRVCVTRFVPFPDSDAHTKEIVDANVFVHHRCQPIFMLCVDLEICLSTGRKMSAGVCKLCEAFKALTSYSSVLAVLSQASFYIAVVSNASLDYHCL